MGFIPVGPDKSSSVGQSPTLGPRVNVFCILALGTSKGEAIHFREVERALSLPILGVDGARHNTWDTRWCTAGETRTSVMKDCFGAEGDILLPVEQRLIAQEPLPLSVNGVVHRYIREHGARRIVCVEAISRHLVRPVSVVRAC